MPAATVTVLYPSGSDAKFDMDYYLSSHMPLAQKLWGKEGLKSWKVLKFGDDQPYSVQATLEFESVDDYSKAMASDGTKEILADVPNFSNKSPTLMMGEVVGKQ